MCVVSSIVVFFLFVLVVYRSLVSRVSVMGLVA